MAAVTIVGAGFSGSVVAEQLAAAGIKVLVVKKRPHVAGSAYDEFDDHGVLVHRYGPHIFHTNAERVFAYLSRFTEWRDYEHRVLANTGGRLYPIPINLDTINRFFGERLDEAGAAAFLERKRERREPVKTSEDVVVNTVGRELFQAFFEGYTRKHWGMEGSRLDASVTARIPVRTCRDDRYFGDTFQAMPANGYTALFRNMLDHLSTAS